MKEFGLIFIQATFLPNSLSSILIFSLATCFKDLGLFTFEIFFLVGVCSS